MLYDLLILGVFTASAKIFTMNYLLSLGALACEETHWCNLGQEMRGCLNTVPFHVEVLLNVVAHIAVLEGSITS